MPRLSLPQFVIAGSACAVALAASGVWNTKDYTQWTSEETYKVLTDSPWAKQKSVSVAQPGMGEQRRSGNGSGGGSNRGGMGGGGIGFPGGGIGFPGGGGGGGGRRNGGGQRQDDGTRGGGRSSMNVILRWESAQPVQHALLRQGTPQESDQKHYVIAVLGLRMPNRESDRDSNDSDLDRGDDKKDNDKLRSQLLDAAQLIPNSKVGIAAEDVQFEGRNGSTAIRFLFPKTFPLAAEDKEITFLFQSRGMKLEHKFHLGDMVYQGKLAL